MKSFLLVLLGFVVGGIVSFILASGLMTGIGAGVGIATGLQAGACLTAEAAKEQGYITSEQVEDLLRAAGRQIASADAPPEAGPPVGDAECAEVVAKLKAASSQ